MLQDKVELRAGLQMANHRTDCLSLLLLRGRDCCGWAAPQLAAGQSTAFIYLFASSVEVCRDWLQLKSISCCGNTFEAVFSQPTWPDGQHNVKALPAQPERHCLVTVSQGIAKMLVLSSWCRKPEVWMLLKS